MGIEVYYVDLGDRNITRKQNGETSVPIDDIINDSLEKKTARRILPGHAETKFFSFGSCPVQLYVCSDEAFVEQTLPSGELRHRPLTVENYFMLGKGASYDSPNNVNIVIFAQQKSNDNQSSENRPMLPGRAA